MRILAKLGERKQNSRDRQARLAKVEWISSEGDVEQRRTGCGETETDRPVSISEVQIALRLNAIFG